jgi:hypothetical protein
MECRTGRRRRGSWQTHRAPVHRRAPLCFASEWGACVSSPSARSVPSSAPAGRPRCCRPARIGRDRWEDVATCAESDLRPGRRPVRRLRGQSVQLRRRPAPAVRSFRDRCSRHGVPVAMRRTCYASGAGGLLHVCDGLTPSALAPIRFQECTIDRGGFGAPTPCEHGCQDEAGNADYCAGCPLADEVACVEEADLAPRAAVPPIAGRGAPPSRARPGSAASTTAPPTTAPTPARPNEASCVGRRGCTPARRTGRGSLPRATECATRPVCGGASGAFSPRPRGALPCGDAFCVDGACVECVGATRECVPDTTARRECVAGTWQLENLRRAHGRQRRLLSGRLRELQRRFARRLSRRRHASPLRRRHYATTECTGANPACNPVTV